VAEDIATAPSESRSELQNRLERAASQIRGAAVRSRRVWILSWVFVPVVIGAGVAARWLEYLLTISITTNYPNGAMVTAPYTPTWIPVIAVIPCAIVFGFALWELFSLRDSGRLIPKRVFPHESTLMAKRFSSGSELIQDSQRLVTQARDQLAFSFWVFLFGGFLLGTSLAVNLSPFGAFALYPQPWWVAYFTLLFPAGFALLLWPLLWLGRHWLAEFQQLLDSQVREFSQLEQAFFARFARSPATG
jgi:hypothetical protein